MGFWLADHPNAKAELPTKQYIFDQSIHDFTIEGKDVLKLHGHLCTEGGEDVCGNGISYHWKNLLDKIPHDAEFLFVSEAVEQGL